MSATRLLNHLQRPNGIPEAMLHPPGEQAPFLHIEFHGRAGFSIVCFEKASSIGYVASVEAKLSSPEVLVCLGGQVIEKWPPELFFNDSGARPVIVDFLKAGKQSRKCKWVRLDRFPRKTIHKGGKGLIELWRKIKAEPAFPFSAKPTSD